MPSMNIILDAERDGFPSMSKLASGVEIPPHAQATAGDYLVEQGKLVHLTNEIEVGALAGGMESGAPSAAFCFTLPDGRVVLAETSLALFLTAADALKAKYGDPRR